MRSIAIYADSGMGKTMLVERFKRANPPVYSAAERRSISPVVALQMPSHATERRFYAHLLSEVGVPFFARATILDLETQALRSLKRMDTKLLMLDEVHNILAGSAKEQHILLNTLRYISNELKISLVCLGISEAREAISGDVQLARRFEELPLTRWHGNEDFQELIVAILRHLPLKLASQISARALRHVLQSTDGVTAQIFGMFNDLAVEAIRSRTECIEDKHRGVASFHPSHPGLRVRGPEQNSPPLPYTVPPFPGELLSSWLTRIAADYRISLAQLCQHLGLSVIASPVTDNGLLEADIQRVAVSTRSSTDDIRRMMRRPVHPSGINLVAGHAPIQFCRSCRALHSRATAEPVAIMSWFEFWQIECLECRLPFSTNVKPNLHQSDPARDYPEWFSKVLPVARKGGRRLEAFARCPIGGELTPVAVLCLLSISLTRRLVDYRSSYDRNWGRYHRIAELFVPGLRTLSSEHQLIPSAWTSGKPVRLVTPRAILLAAMAAFFVNVRHQL